MNTVNIRHIFQSQFDYRTYCNEIVRNIFGCGDINAQPELLCTTAEGDRSHYIGRMADAEGREIGFFYTRMASGGDVRRKRVGLRKLIAPYVKYDVDAAIAVFDDGHHWRLSYICDMKEGTTSAKRFSYVFGDEQGQYNTPVHRLLDLGMRAPHLCLKNIFDAFSVETLSKEFFDEYHLHYDRIVAELERQGNAGTHYHDYVKKMMGRIVFLHFLQKKGWLNANPYFLRDLFGQQSPSRQSDFLEQVLEPLFFGIFNTDSAKRQALFAQRGWDMGLLDEWTGLPYLNGGLFEEDEVDTLKIKLPASLFEDLFSFLASYNFTVDENDPDDAEVGVDPEMLGKIFESLLEDNKAKGAFYTPKEIVRYMCKESLIAYLSSKVESEKADAVRLFVEHHEISEALEPCREVIDTALREVKICDPAIGSGAFPMGLLSELWRCREAIEGNVIPRVELKKEIIENNVYGVDIEKGAIDIARLRFWLSIVVDAEKPEPLPNFDYKFMQGNSLIESYKGIDLSRISNRLRGGQSKSPQLLLGLDSDLSRKNLQRLLRDYFSVSDHRQKASMRQAVNDEVKRLIVDFIGGTASDLAKLDPSANQDFFLWHTWFKDIFDKGGFDIVIGNPPYIEAKKLKHIASTLKPLFEVYSGTADLSIYFVEHGKNLLVPNGILSYIMTNKFFNTGYGKSLRKLIISNNINKIINFEQVEVFEGVLVSSVILEMRKAKSANSVFTYEKFYKLNVSQFKEQFVSRIGSFGTYPSSELDGNEWSFSDVSSLNIKRHIENGHKILGNSEGVNIYRGVTTGYNPAFIIDNAKRDELIAEDSKNAAIIKNMLQGRNIRKWYYNESNQYLVQTGFDLDIPSLYPKVYEHLNLYYEEMVARSDQGKNWWNLRACQYYGEFEKPEKIIWGLTADKWAYTLDTEGHYLPSNGYILTSTKIPIKYILGLLNSKLLHYYFKFIGVMTAGGAYTLKAATISALPLADTNDYTPMINLVDRILTAKKANPLADTTTEEREIDRLVYNLYGLTEEEIAVIEETTNRD